MGQYTNAQCLTPTPTFGNVQANLVYVVNSYDQLAKRGLMKYCMINEKGDCNLKNDHYCSRQEHGLKIKSLRLHIKKGIDIQYESI